MQRAAAVRAVGQRGGRGHAAPPPPITPVLTVSAWRQVSRLGIDHPRYLDSRFTNLLVILTLFSTIITSTMTLKH